MSEEKEKDKELKKLSKELLTKQIQEAEGFIRAAQQQIVRLQEQIQQQVGVAGFAKHLSEQFEIPEKIAEPKKLEVK